MFRKGYPVQKGNLPRAEVNVLKVDADGNSIYDEDFDPNICHCFPPTSSIRLPSMIYDGLKCDHDYTQHIQPAQQTVFSYPWTANTIKGRVLDDERDSLRSGKLSMIAEEQGLPANVTRTAPPFASPTKRIQKTKGPFSAPVDSHWESHGPEFRRVNSEQSVRRLFSGGRPRTLDSREFRGKYVDPKDGQVYNFNVNYGKRNVQASRQADDNLRLSPVEYR